jgi:imidazole glycerol phosphate synthase glutamine amidotransferase subunit
MIAVIDYGAGNLRSVANALDAAGASYALASTPESLTNAEKIILPGVGHFGQMMRALDDLNLRGVLIDRIESGVPFLGICLGMQALFEGSDEAPDVTGLGIFPGRSARFPKTVRVPHMGWNQVSRQSSSKLMAAFQDDPWFYFAHSFYIPQNETTAALCEYALPYSAAIERENIFGVQFHPEKSADSGQLLLRGFLER